MISMFEITIAIILAILSPIVAGILIIQIKDLLKLLRKVFKITLL